VHGGLSPFVFAALTKSETYAYDNNGNLTTVTDRKSQVIGVSL